jgi:hypothetical protein
MLENFEESGTMNLAHSQVPIADISSPTGELPPYPAIWAYWHIGGESPKWIEIAELTRRQCGADTGQVCGFHAPNGILGIEFPQRQLSERTQGEITRTCRDLPR